MKKNLCSLLLLVVITISVAPRVYAQPKLNKSNIKEVATAMTLDDKAHLVVGMDMNFGLLPSAAKKDSSKPANDAQQGPVIDTTLDKVAGAAGTMYAVSRLGIPSIVVAEEWIADTGKYTLKAGASSANIRLSANFNLPKDITVEKINKVLQPQQSVNETKTVAVNATNTIEELNGFAISM